MVVIINRIYTKPVFLVTFCLPPPSPFTSTILFLIPPPALLELSICQKRRAVDAPPVERE